MPVSISLVTSLTPDQILQLTEILRYAETNNEGVTIHQSDIDGYYRGVLSQIHENQCVMAVAEVSGKLIGSIIGRFYPAFNTRHLAYFEKLIVVREYRNKGVGTKLIQLLEDHVRKLGKERIELSVREGNPAQKLYETLGYRVWGIAKKENKTNDGYLDEVYMEKLFV